MRLEGIDVNRLVIFFFYDKQGVVDDYITYMLNDLKENTKEILVVCNGKLTREGRHKFEQITNHIYVRDNVGFDVWAYKEGLEYYGWEAIKEFDEIILMNFTIMGPLYSFKEMFDTMNQKDIDFWGITAFHEVPFDPFGTIKYGYIPEHIQSHFIAVRKPMIQSPEFHDYWESRPPITRYEEAVGMHEAIFTKDFSDKGFTYEVYIDTKDLVDITYCPIINYPLTLVRDKRCPIIKRRSFFHGYDDTLNNTVGEATIELFEYIKEHLDYDIGMIWKNILRAQNMADIKKQMHLNYILPDRYSIPKEENKRVEKIALVMHIYFEDLIDYCLEYAISMPNEADIYITTDTEAKKCKIQQACEKYLLQTKFNKIEVILIENRGRDVSALLVGVKDFIMEYDYVCFAHDKKTLQAYPHSIGEGFSYKCFENILGSKQYVENIIQTFRNEPYLGMLMPSPPNHADFYPTLSNMSWGPNFEITLNLYKQLKLEVDINNYKEPIAPLGTMFWFRPVAMKKLFDKNWEYRDFPKEPNNTDGTLLHGIERIYPFVIQDAGYFNAHVYSEKMARIEITNLDYMNRALNNTLFPLFGVNSQHQLIHTINYKINNDIDMINAMNNIGWVGMLKTDVKFRFRNNKIIYACTKAGYKGIRKIYRIFKR